MLHYFLVVGTSTNFVDVHLPKLELVGSLAPGALRGEAARLVDAPLLFTGTPLAPPPMPRSVAAMG